MKVPEPEQETPLAWNAIVEHTPVYSADETDIGGVHEVLGAEDIFHGLVVRSGPFGRDVMIPAENVTAITNRRIQIGLADQDIRELPPFVPEDTFHLGIVGLFRKHVGWVRGSERDHPGET